MTLDHKERATNIFEILKRYDFLVNLANSKASFLLAMSGVVIVLLLDKKDDILKLRGE